MDVGIRLVQVSDERVVDVDTLLFAINTALAPYGYKVRQWASWPALLAAARQESDFIQRYFESEDDHRE